jgi:hypothetical protein
MENNTIIFDNPIGTFKESVRAYREYKKEWRKKMEVKLAQMEEEIKQAKSDPFFKIDN